MADTNVNFSVSSVLTDDVIVNRNGGVTDTTQTPIDGTLNTAANNALVTQSFASYAFASNPSGLPDSGFFASNSYHPDIQLNYNNTNNGNNSRQIKTSTGSFSFNVNQNKYKAIHVALVSTQGSSNVRLTFNYTDGTTETSSAATVPDWYDEVTENTNLYYLLDGMDRSKSDGTGYENANDPALFGLRFVPNANKILNSITVEKTTSSGYLSFFGATGVVPNQAPTGITLSASNVAENQAIGTVIGNLSTTDLDDTTFTYSIVSGVGDASAFSISGNQLRTNSIFDYESKNSYTVRVRSTDQGGLTVDKDLTIGVTNVNEYPSHLFLSANTIAENSSLGTTIGTFSSLDPDGDTTFTYSIAPGIGDASAFSISGNQLKSKAACKNKLNN